MPAMRTAVECRRCGKLAENPEACSGNVPDGKGKIVPVDDLILCCFCLGVMLEDRKRFWKDGWSLRDE